MTTRLNSTVSVICEEDTLMALNGLAKKRKVSIATVAHDLIEDSLEDLYLSKLAQKRHRKNPKLISHHELWKTTNLLRRKSHRV